MSLSTRITAAAALAGIFTLSPAIRPAVAADASFHGLNAALGEGASAIPCARAVRRVLPSGWRIQGEQALLGCAPVSWDATDTALSVYQRIAGESGLSIIADIADETIAIGRPAGGASDSRSGSMTAAGPTAFVGTSVRVPLAAIASRYDLALRCGAPCDRALPGPITLELSGDIGEDAKLLADGLGPIEPLAIVEDPVGRTLSVNLARQSSFAVELPRKKPWWRRWF